MNLLLEIKNSEKLSIDELNQCFELLISTQTLLSDHKGLIEIKKEYAISLSQAGKFDQANKIYKEIIKSLGHYATNNRKLGNFLYSLWMSCSSGGMVEEGNQCAEIYLNYLLAKKSFGRGLQFVDEVCKSGFDVQRGEFYKIKFLILQGDIKTISEHVSTLNIADIFAEKILNQELSNVIRDELDVTAWRKSQNIYEAKLASIMGSFQTTEIKSKALLSARKKFISLLIEYHLKFPDSLLGLHFSLSYGQLFRKKNLLIKIKKYLTSMESALNAKPRVRNKFNKIVSELENMPEDKKIAGDQTDNWDLGQDLFKEQTSEQSDEERKLVRDIKFLSKSGDKNKLKKLIEKLESIHKNHEFVVKFRKEEKKAEKKEFQDASSTIGGPGLFELVQKLSQDEYKLEEEKSQAAHKKFVEFLEDDVIIKFHSDLVACYNDLGFYEASLELLKKVEARSEPEKIGELKIGIAYLKVETLIANGDLYRALEIADDMLLGQPLVKDEVLCFKYLKAEILKGLRKGGMAKKLYNQIYKLNPNYRLVRKRKTEIEKSK